MDEKLNEIQESFDSEVNKKLNLKFEQLLDFLRKCESNLLKGRHIGF